MSVDRSLWADARRRLAANRAAVASAALLALVALACLVGPSLTGHPYDRLYPDYVRVPPRLAAYPLPEAVAPALDRVAARLRARTEGVMRDGDTLRLALTSPRSIDERLLAYFPRADLFGPARVVAREDEGRRLVLDVPVRRERFLLGTDALGRDLLTRCLVAGRISLAVGLLATAVALLIGVGYGAVAGYLGGAVDAAMMRLVDILYALPFIFFVIMLVVFFGRHFVLVFVAIGAVEWLDMARIVRGQTLAIRRQDYVLAAEALGVSTPAVIARHVVPNALGPVVVFATLMIPRIILLESFLSFLGLGVQEPMTSWGVLIAEGARGIDASPWMLMAPAGFLVVTLMALNFLGDGLRDALDPRDR